MAHTALVSLIKIPAIRTCFTCVERSSPFKLTRTHLILHICWGRRFSNRNIVRIFDPAGRRCRSLLGQLRLQLFLFLLDIVFLLLNILDQFAFSLNLRRKTIWIDGDVRLFLRHGYVLARNGFMCRHWIWTQFKSRTWVDSLIWKNLVCFTKTFSPWCSVDVGWAFRHVGFKVWLHWLTNCWHLCIISSGLVLGLLYPAMRRCNVFKDWELNKTTWGPSL
jgi:hypothetical protein